MTELEKMRTGQWFNTLDPEIDDLREITRRAVWEHNSLHPDERDFAGPALRALFAEFGPGAYLEAPFHCAYGFNLHFGPGVYLNAGCVILDSAPVRIGARTMLGPQVKIFCPEHHQDAGPRAAGQEIARPVTLGEDVWIGGGATILGGVTVGAGAIVAAGAVVTKDVAPGAKVAGVPARPM